MTAIGAWERARRLATGSPYGLAAFCLGWALTIVGANLEALDPAPTHAAVVYGSAHPLARSDWGGTLLTASPARGLLLPVALIVPPLLLCGYLHARDVGPRDSDSIRGAATRGGSIAGGYAAAALAASWTFELRGAGLISGGTSMEPLSTTISAFVCAILVGGLGGILAEHVERRIALAFATVPTATLLYTLYLAATW